MRVGRPGALVALVLGMLLWGAVPALAHVELVVAIPGSGETLAVPPSAVSLEFSGPLQPGGGHAIGVTDPAGARIDDGSTVEVSDRIIETGVSGASGPGTYTVEWFVVAGDGDDQSGAYTFTVEGAPVGEGPQDEPTTGEQQPLPPPSELPAADDADGAPTPEPEPEPEPEPQPEPQPEPEPSEEPDGAAVPGDDDEDPEAGDAPEAAPASEPAAPSEAAGGTPAPTPSATGMPSVEPSPADLAVESGGGFPVLPVAVAAGVLAVGVGVWVARRQDEA